MARRQLGRAAAHTLQLTFRVLTRQTSGVAQAHNLLAILRRYVGPMPRAAKSIRFFPGNGWMFGRRNVRERVADLRASYGDNCWRCGHPMSFHPIAVRRGATIEHLLAKAHGGTSRWENIRLCHRGCNWHLGTHPPEQKLRMRLTLARESVPEFAARVKARSTSG